MGEEEDSAWGGWPLGREGLTMTLPDGHRLRLAFSESGVVTGIWDRRGEADWLDAEDFETAARAMGLTNNQGYATFLALLRSGEPGMPLNAEGVVCGFRVDRQQLRRVATRYDLVAAAPRFFPHGRIGPRRVDLLRRLCGLVEESLPPGGEN